jgi:phage terminase large subunit-like protein
VVRRIGPQPGPQTLFSATPADIAIYGGSAGGGKTWSLAYEAGRYTTVPGYSAAVFRRTSPELTGGGSIFEESKRIYPHLGGFAREHPNLDWRFPKTGALIEFRHMQHEHSVSAHQSKQYHYIGFDELTHFTANQFWYMLSRLRGGDERVPKRVRGTCNPDPDSFVRALIDWYIGEDGLAIEERSGVIRWFVRLDERLIWGSSPEDVWRQDRYRIRQLGEPARNALDARPQPMSFTFIRARASDNQVLLRNDPGYLARLNMLPGAQAKRLRDGNWNARDSAGDYFDRSWCGIVDDVAPKNIVRSVRFWDKAATKPSPTNPDPDWTRGVRVRQLDNGFFVFDELQSLRDGPAIVDERIKLTAQIDAIECEVGMWQDPGQAGVVDVEHAQKLLYGFAFQTIKATKNLETYAKVWTGLAKTGKLLFLRREYLPEVYAELEGFPFRKHDDIMSGLCGCMVTLLGAGFEFDYEGAPDDRHPGRVRDAYDDDDDDDDGASGGGRGAYI